MVLIERNNYSISNIKNKLDLYSNKLFHISMPLGLRSEILNWIVVSKSPYSYSFYDITNKFWDEGVL